MPPANRAVLNARARKILNAITQEYLNTGEAVGSRTVTRRYGVDLSPATVRNVMSDLEELGMIEQRHTSAGRIPTQLGLRFFVDSLLEVRQFSDQEREDLATKYSFPTGVMDAALREASKVLSDLSSHTVVVTLPRAADEVLHHIEFVRVRDSALLAVLVSQSGRVQNKLVQLGPAEQLSSDDLERIHNYLNLKLEGRTLAEVRRHVEDELASERIRYDALAHRALLLQQQALPDPETSVLVTGQANLISHLLDDEPHPDPERLKALLRALDDRRILLQLLQQTEAASSLQVFIGAENGVPELSDNSVVASAYGDGRRAVGALGIIGPTRMNYSRVIALVDFTAQLLSSVMTQPR